MSNQIYRIRYENPGYNKDLTEQEWDFLEDFLLTDSHDSRVWIEKEVLEDMVLSWKEADKEVPEGLLQWLRGYLEEDDCAEFLIG